MVLMAANLLKTLYEVTITNSLHNSLSFCFSFIGVVFKKRKVLFLLENMKFGGNLLRVI